ncbi:hypothetical protein HDU97_002841 [Phlyctochytrium planicorne]|nr:hypothetical protein HDU97_002841 [Phlyctochytrium planicorne]
MRNPSSSTIFSSSLSAALDYLGSAERDIEDPTRSLSQFRTECVSGGLDSHIQATGSGMEGFLVTHPMLRSGDALAGNVGGLGKDFAQAQAPAEKNDGRRQGFGGVDGGGGDDGSKRRKRVRMNDGLASWVVGAPSGRRAMDGSLESFFGDDEDHDLEGIQRDREGIGGATSQEPSGIVRRHDTGSFSEIEIGDHHHGLARTQLQRSTNLDSLPPTKSLVQGGPHRLIRSASYSNAFRAASNSPSPASSTSSLHTPSQFGSGATLSTISTDNLSIPSPNVPGGVSDPDTAAAGSSSSTPPKPKPQQQFPEILKKTITARLPRPAVIPPTYRPRISRGRSRSAPPPPHSLPRPPSPPPQLHPCPHSQCTRKFKDPAALDAHIARRHQPYKCPHPGCTAEFLRNHDLNRHKLRHARRKFVCKGCGKAFSRKDARRRHRRETCVVRWDGVDEEDEEVEDGEVELGGGGDSEREAGSVRSATADDLTPIYLRLEDVEEDEEEGNFGAGGGGGAGYGYGQGSSSSSRFG